MLFSPPLEHYVAPYLESIVAALAFNRGAREDFAEHECNAPTARQHSNAIRELTR